MILCQAMSSIKWCVCPPLHGVFMSGNGVECVCVCVCVCVGRRGGGGREEEKEREKGRRKIVFGQQNKQQNHSNHQNHNTITSTITKTNTTIPIRTLTTNSSTILPKSPYSPLQGRHEKLLTSSPSDRIQVDSHLGRLTFKPLKHDDSGTYRCRAVNDAGEASSNISLHVLGPFHLTDSLFDNSL